jgi:hypothetical protein
MAHSPVRLGRNDLCYCGSGKKFKKCCLNKPPSREEVVHQELITVSEQLRNKILQFAATHFGEQFEEAWEDFNFGEMDGPSDPKNPENTIFIPFFMFLWDPDAPDGQTTDNVRGGIISRRFLLDQLLTEMERQLLQSYMTEPVSFYEVISVQPNQGFFAHDILTNTQLEVRERLATGDLVVGEILYAQMCPVGGITTMNFHAPFRIPPAIKPLILALRKALQEQDGQRESLFQQDLQEFAEDIRECYLDIRDHLLAPPVLINTDGDLLEIHTMTFDVESAQAAFDALAPLAAGVPREALLHNGEYDAAGALSKVEFQWLKKGNRKFSSWENTVLGDIKLEGRSLVAEANSEKRARKLRKEIEKRLGRTGAIHRSTDVKSFEEDVIAEELEG